MAHRTHPQKSVSVDAKSPTGCIFYPASLFSLHPPTQVNDSTVSLPVSSESGAAERVNDNTTSKPPSDEAEGSVQETVAYEGNHGCEFHLMFSLLYLHSGFHCCCRLSDQQIFTFLSSVPLQAQHPEGMSRENAPAWSRFSERWEPHSCLSLL